MAKGAYRFPKLSMLAYYVQRYVLPDRVHAWIWLSALDELEEHARDIDHHNEDGSRELFSAISTVRVETLRRQLCKGNLYATLEEAGNES